MCGIKMDIIYSSRKVRLCTKCEKELNNCTLPNGYVKTLKHELKQIKKTR
jgi:hypothetical protein